MSPLASLLRRFAKDESGVFAVLFGLMAIVLIALGGATVDYVTLEQTRQRAQVALDAAALALQPEIYSKTEAQLQALAEALMLERIGSERIDAEVIRVTKDEALGSLYLEAGMNMPTMFVSLVGVQSLGARIFSEAVHGTTDLEVAVALDLSGSMAQAIPDGNGGTTTKIASLRTALHQLIDLLVQDEQTPTYSKMALVPYSQAVNVGSYANTVRGPIVQPTAISNITWSSSPERTITGATQANPVVITASNHGFSNGDTVYISGTGGTMSQINNRIFTVSNVNTNTFRLNSGGSGVNGTGYSAYSGNQGRVTRCLVATCELVVTSNNHGLSAGADAYISGVVGMNSFPSPGNSTSNSFTRYNNNPAFDNTNFNWINNNPSDVEYRFLVWTIGAVTANTFVLPGTPRTNGKNYGTYSSGGTVACVIAGCSHYLFTNPYSNTGWYGANAANTSKRRHAISTCVTERDTNNATDTSYLTTPVGRNYAASNNPCIIDTILPLTATKGANVPSNVDKSTLHGVANTLAASGSTGGQIGVAWAWYLLSPNFNGPWPAASRPAMNGTTPPVVKALVIMTDGEYNSIYRNGVIAQNSTSGSGDTNSMIGQNAANGSSYEQTARLCSGIKAAGITVYTVGLAIDDKPVAQELMRNCASDPGKAYVAGSGQALSAVFADIAGQLSNLRLAR